MTVTNRLRIISAFAVVILAVLSGTVFLKEGILREGKTVYLKLAPVDPRSLMQGDYMTLRYALANEIRDLHRTAGGSSLDDDSSIDGYVIVKIDEQGRAQSPRLSTANEPVGDQELKLFFRQRGRGVRIATDAFFFQEGQQKRFEKAAYGILKVNSGGESVLTGLSTESLEPLTASF